MCTHLGPGPHGTLCCDRKDAHDEAAPGNHTYSAPGFPDAHDASEARAEAER